MPDAVFPKIVHQILLRDEESIDHHKLLRKDVELVMPGWEVRLWREPDLRKIRDRFVCPDLVFDENRPSLNREELFRYEILRLHGGIYMNQGVRIFRNLEEILIPDCVHLPLERDKLESISNAVIASPANHPFWEFLLWNLHSLESGNLEITDCITLASIIVSWIGKIDASREILADDHSIAGWLYENINLLFWSSNSVRADESAEKGVSGPLPDRRLHSYATYPKIGIKSSV